MSVCKNCVSENRILVNTSSMRDKISEWHGWTVIILAKGITKEKGLHKIIGNDDLWNWYAGNEIYANGYGR